MIKGSTIAGKTDPYGAIGPRLLGWNSYSVFL
jgi:hypothetical protein